MWCRPPAVALIQSLAWELPNAMGAALKSKTNKPKKQPNCNCSGPGHCGGTGLIPRLEQWVKGSGIAAAAA